ncbi:TetR/AcrR family transcriptional regulator C-terminal domain-containing protein [Furfurilactobacillus cerevisiae]|uniref:TetR/AcrR family transcriptional regulator C-terminal domain-containing protein n=1 Tax=Furfurilactobacillus rossiae TaxID=231049 RepID=UPI003B9824A6
MPPLVEQQFANTLLTQAEQTSLAKISTSSLIQASQLGRQTFYNHFHDKYQLITWIFKQDSERGLQKKHRHDWLDTITAIFNEVYSRHDFYREALTIQGQNSLRDYLHDYDVQLYTRLFKELTGSGKLSNDTLFALDFYTSGCFESTLTWLQSARPVDPAEHARQVNLSMPVLLAKQLEQH